MALLRKFATPAIAVMLHMTMGGAFPRSTLANETDAAGDPQIFIESSGQDADMFAFPGTDGAPVAFVEAAMESEMFDATKDSNIAEGAFTINDWVITSGDDGCHISGNCVMSRGFPGDYASADACTVTVAYPLYVIVWAFRTETNHDLLHFNGVGYSGSQGPPSGHLFGELIWSTDGSVQASGWKICKENGHPEEVNPAESARTYSTVWENDPIGTGHARSMLGSAQAWSAGRIAAGEWMQMDLGGEMRVTGVVTQGRYDDPDHFQAVTWFRVAYSQDGFTFTFTEDAMEFEYTGDMNDKVVALIHAPFRARFVRLIVQEWLVAPSMRAGVLVDAQALPELALVSALPELFMFIVGIFVGACFCWCLCRPVRRPGFPATSVDPSAPLIPEQAMRMGPEVRQPASEGDISILLEKIRALEAGLEEARFGTPQQGSS